MAAFPSPHSQVEVYISGRETMTKRKSKGAYMISAVAEMLSRLAGVSEAGARWRNPECTGAPGAPGFGALGWGSEGSL